MRIVRLLKRHVQFSKRERLSFSVLLTILFSCLCFTVWVHYYNPPATDHAQLIWEDHSSPLPSGEGQSSSPPAAFNFDPNTVTYDELIALGLSPKASGTLIKYRNSGAQFKSAKDLSKIYGISPGELERLYPLVVIGSTNHSDAGSEKKFWENEQAEKESIMQPFNPNELGYQDWVNLGIPEKVAATAVSYVKKGGRFKSSDDLMKIYGFQPEDMERLKPFVQIQAVQEEMSVQEEKVEVELIATGQLDINKITLAEITSCGLNQQAAWKVMNYRDKLGGFYSAQQFTEIKGLENADLLSLLQCVYVNAEGTRKLRINSAGFTELANHPYLSDKLARAIIHYRDSTGKFISVNEITRAYRVSPQYLEKLKYYLSL